jgi:hypothetical protein
MVSPELTWLSCPLGSTRLVGPSFTYSYSKRPLVGRVAKMCATYNSFTAIRAEDPDLGAD